MEKTQRINLDDLPGFKSRAFASAPPLERASREPRVALESALEPRDFPHRFLPLAAAALRARHAGFGLTGPGGAIVEFVLFPAEALEPDLDREGEGRALAAFVLTEGDLFRTDFRQRPLPEGATTPIGSLLGVRHSYAGRCGGALFFTRGPDEPPFTPEDERIALALQRFLEHQDLAEVAQLLLRVRLTNQISHAASFDADLSKTLRAVFHELGRHIPMSLIALWRVHEDEGELGLAARGDLPVRLDGSGAVDRRPFEPGARLAVREGPFQSCVEQGQTLYLDRLKESALSRACEWAEQGFTSCLAVPLSSGQKPVGVLQVLGTRPQGLTRWQIQLVCSVADLLGPAIANFQLYERLKLAYQQLQKAQEQLVNVEKMRALGEMATGMAHDFNNALCGMLGFIELALQDAALVPSTRESLTMAKTCAMDAAATVRRVQDFARWKRGVSEARLLNPNQLLDEAANLTRPRWSAPSADGSPIHVEVHAEADAGLAGNASELREVLTNLIFNAVDAMPKGGRLTLRAANTDAHVLLSIEDTGVGMSEEVRQRLFEPFFSTKREHGTGLGLSVSYAIVKRHGGTIQVSSAPGKGSRFTLQLPVAGRMDRAAEPAAKPKAAHGLRVLVVDDEPRILTFLRHSLTHMGNEVQTADSGPEGLEQFRTGAYDLVITDMGMSPMDGAELARDLRRRSPDTPIILLTGWADQLRASGLTPEGVDLVLAKPLTLDELAAGIQQVTESRRPLGAA